LQEPSKVDRRQSFQDYRTFRDKFVGRLEFKDTLRRTTTNNDEPRKPTTASDRSSLRDLRTAHHPRGRPHSGGDVRDFVGERSGGYLIETDFDFRSPPSTRDSSRDRSHYARPYEGSCGGGSRGTPRRGQEQIYATPARRQKEADSPAVYASSVVVRRGGRDQPEELLTSTALSRRSENGDSGSGVPLRRKELKVVISEPQSPGDCRYPGSDYGEPLSPTTPKDPLR
jgi:hypothetical protein